MKVNKDNSIKKLPMFNSNIEVKKSNLLGANQFKNDKVNFDDQHEVIDFLLHKIVKITFWYGDAYSPQPPVVNGVKFTYKNILTNEITETKEKYGMKNLQGSETHALQEGEHIVGANLRSGWIMDNLTFILNTGRTISAGGKGGDFCDFDFKNSVILGSYGTYGQTMYSIGFYYLTTDEFKFNNFLKKRFLFLIINCKLKDRHEELITMIDFLIKNNYKKFYSEIAFGKLCLLPKHIFASVILFVN